jgi:hypothetical protein
MLNKNLLPVIALLFFFTFFQDFYRKYFIDHEMDPPMITMDGFKRGLEL